MHQSRPVPRLALSLALLALITAAPACKTGASTQAGSGEARPQAAAPAVPDDFRMVFGEGGGVTGRWTGYTIGPGGAVQSWSGRMAEENGTPAGRLSAAQMEELWQRVREADVFEADGGEPGNITAFIELTAEGRTHRVVWVPGAENFEDPRTPVEALYRYSLRLASQAGQQ